MVTRPIPVKAPLRFLPRGVGGKAEEASTVGGGDSMSMQSAELWACETLSRESWDCVSAVGVSGMSSSSEMGDGMRLLLRSSESMSCRGPFQAGGGACIDEVCMLFMSMPPAEPLAG